MHFPEDPDDVLLYGGMILHDARHQFFYDHRKAVLPVLFFRATPPDVCNADITVNYPEGIQTAKTPRYSELREQNGKPHQ